MQRPLFDEGRHPRGEALRGSAFVIDTGNTKEMPSGLLPWPLLALPLHRVQLRGHLFDHTIGATDAALQVGRPILGWASNSGRAGYAGRVY